VADRRLPVLRFSLLLLLLLPNEYDMTIGRCRSCRVRLLAGPPDGPLHGSYDCPATSAAAPYRISFCSPTFRPAYHTSPPPVKRDLCVCGVSVCVSARAAGAFNRRWQRRRSHSPLARQPIISATAANHCSRAAYRREPVLPT